MRRWWSSLDSIEKITAVGVLVAAFGIIPGYLALRPDGGPSSPATTVPLTTTTLPVTTTTRTVTTLGPTGRSITQITELIPDKPSASTGVFFSKSLTINWRGGSVVLSGTSDGRGRIYVDDGIRLTVRSGNAEISDIIDLSDNCRNFDNRSPPIDISKYLKPGKNVLEIALISRCPPVQGSSDLRLVGRFEPA